LKFVALTPDRSDRPELLELCEWQMKRQTMMVEHRVINYPPESRLCDLTQRVRRGCQEAKEDGIDYAIIIENDDYYPVDWIEQVHSSLEELAPVDFMGIPGTTYYNIWNRSWQGGEHAAHATLFCTTINTDLPTEVWPKDSKVSLDLYLWRTAIKRFGLVAKYFDVPNRPIGIKHGMGKIVTPSHGKTFRRRDPSLTYLKKVTDTKYLDRLMSLWRDYKEAPNRRWDLRSKAGRRVSSIREQQQLDRGHVPPQFGSVSIRSLQE
jgi:hypothetical protein